jgi:hypothetical protein
MNPVARTSFALALAAALCGVGVAQTQTVTPEQAIALLDTGKDGKVDLSDYLAYQKPKLARFDADGSGGLSQAEFVASLPEREKVAGATAIPTFDRDGDTALGEAEFLAYHAYVFRTFVDTDGDGAMSAAELAAVSGPAPAPAAAAAPAAAPNPLAMLDYNRDGKTELNEYLNFQLPNLKKNDANGNGRLSRDEFKASLPENGRGRAQQSFLAFDRDKDKGLDQDEFLGYHAFVFNNVLDKNKDGFVTREEFAAMRP